jgi:phosphate starvation-inducible PhoH-like protein
VDLILTKKGDVLMFGTRMSGRASKRERRVVSNAQDDVLNCGLGVFCPPRNHIRPIEALTLTQKQYMRAIQKSQVVFGAGPAGTGKTYLCVALAAEALTNHQIQKVILTRPAVETGAQLGYLPGEIGAKYQPYLIPFLDVLHERLGKEQTERMLRLGTIETAPLAYMRGRTFADTWVILDEAQNTTPIEMKMFLTRIGSNAKMIVNGDPEQKDIRGESGLDDAIARLQGVRRVSVITFDAEDVVRSGMAKIIVQAYSKA